MASVSTGRIIESNFTPHFIHFRDCPTLKEAIAARECIVLWAQIAIATIYKKTTSQDAISLITSLHVVG